MGKGYKKTEIGRACSTMRVRRGAYEVVVEKRETNRPLGRPRRRWDNIKIGFREVGWGHGLDRSCSEYGQVAGSCECGNEP